MKIFALTCLGIIFLQTYWIVRLSDQLARAKQAMRDAAGVMRALGDRLPH